MHASSTSNRSLRRPGDALAGFLARVGGASRRGLVLDFDGTLAPLSASRRDAELSAGVRAALLAIAAAPAPTTLWIVSGRPADELDRLTRLDGVADLWGSHGLERRTHDGCRVAPSLDKSSARMLDEMSAVLHRIGAGSLTERKPYGLAVHWRGADRVLYQKGRDALELLFALAPPDASRELSLEPFDGGLEVRPRDFHKGLVVERAFAELGNDAAVAYVGDDFTDEDAFAAIRGRGLGILVRAEARSTLAEAWLRPPGELLRFLGSWGKACGAGPDRLSAASRARPGDPSGTRVADLSGGPGDGSFQ